MSTPTPKIVQIVIGDHIRDFEIRKMNVLKSAMVSKEFAAVVLPVVSGLKVGAQGADVSDVSSFLKSALTFDVGASVDAVCHALADMEETKLEKLLLNLFSTTSAIGADGVSKVALSDIEAISMASEYDHGAVVKLALEVAEHCLPLGPKVKSLFGAGLEAIAGFGKRTAKDASTKNPSETSEGSETT